MTTIELQTLLDRVKEEIRIFERPSADNSKKMFELLTEAVKNNGVLPLVSNQRELLIDLLLVEIEEMLPESHPIKHSSTYKQLKSN